MVPRLGAFAAHFKRNIPSSVLPMLLVICLGSGCVVRTQEFHCNATLKDGSRQEIDLEMSPTQMRLAGRAYQFKEETGVDRLYQHESGETLRFNVASNQLRSADQVWSCRRYLSP